MVSKLLQYHLGERTIEKTCPCGVIFKSFKSTERVYCSLACCWKYKEKQSPWNIGRKHSPETIEKLKISHKRMWDEGKMDNRKKLLGDLNHSKKSEVKEKIRKSHEKNGIWTPIEQLTEWQRYKRHVQSLTLRNIVFREWKGYCYYCNKYIKEEPKWSKYEPTLDHKKSIFFGFHNNINPEQIADINNLCISCRSCNCSKRENVR